MRTSRCTAALAGLLLLLAATTALADSNKWRLAFSGTARSAGTIVIQLTPKDGAPVEATIAIADGTSENMVAKAVVDGLRAQLPEGMVSVERDDGEDVLVKKRLGQPDFEVVIVSNDVANVRIRPRHE